MNIARKIMLLAAMAVAAMAMTATTASAQETTVEVIEEEGAACNPCSVHIRGESHIRAMPSGVIVSRCTDEFNARIYANGTGEIEWDNEAHVAPGCATVNCTGGVEHHWPLTIGELGTGIEHATVRFCLGAGGVNLHCNGEVLIQEHLPADSHDYEFRTPAAGMICASGTRIIEGMWETEHVAPDQEIRIIHHV